MRLVGLHSDAILAECRGLHPEVDDVLARARAAVPACKREVAQYQAAVLYCLARPYDGYGALLLEIGTALGYSAAVLAQAAEHGRVITMTPKATEYGQAVVHLEPFENAKVEPMRSDAYWDFYTSQYDRRPLDLVFVDGSHLAEDVALDCRWFGRLRSGGLILFHDYSPAGSVRPCPSVMGAVDDFALGLGREPDVLVVDDTEVGMAGWYRRAGER